MHEILKFNIYLSLNKSKKIMYNKLVRIEVMRNLGKEVDDFISSYLTPVEKIWQPTDFLPDPSADSFKHDVEELQTYAQEMGYDLFVTLLVGCLS